MLQKLLSVAKRNLAFIHMMKIVFRDSLEHVAKKNCSENNIIPSVSPID